jgi:hypothetical protein
VRFRRAGTAGGTDGVTLHIAPDATRLRRVAGCSASTPRTRSRCRVTVVLPATQADTRAISPHQTSVSVETAPVRQPGSGAAPVSTTSTIGDVRFPHPRR